MKTGRNRFLKINRGLKKKSFSFKWKQERRHGELDFSKWNQKLKPSHVPCRLLACSPFLQLPPCFPISVMLCRCLFSLMRYLSNQHFVADITISARGQELICAECSALCSGLGLVYIVQCLYPPVPLPAQCYWRASTEACLDINTKVWNYRFFWPPAGSVPTALPRLSSMQSSPEGDKCLYLQTGELCTGKTDSRAKNSGPAPESQASARYLRLCLSFRKLLWSTPFNCCISVSECAGFILNISYLRSELACA